MSVLLQARNLRAYYGATQVLFGFDIAIEEGGITTRLGALFSVLWCKKYYLVMGEVAYFSMQ